MDPIPVAVLGATGTVGQRLVQLLADHPWFRIEALCASERSAGRAYGEAARWMLNGDPPANVAGITVSGLEPIDGVAVAFSALDARVAGDAELSWARAGSLVSSNARNHRMADDVPLVIPEVNADHLELLDRQRQDRSLAAAAGLITNPNCSTIGLVMALAPLERAFGVKSVMVTTLQAASGAGYPGVPALDLLGNVIPNITGEEDKLATESRKILGHIEDGRLIEADLAISAQVNRVPVVDGHLESVAVALRTQASIDDVRRALIEFRGEPQALSLPTAPDPPIELLDADDRPQPARDVMRGRGMAVTIGRLRPCSVLDFKMTVLSHNTIRGAAGAAVLNVETVIARSR